MMGSKTAQIPRSKYGVQEGVTISTAPDTGIGEMDICIDVDDYYTSLLWKGCAWVELTPPPDTPLLMRFTIQELVEGENTDTVTRYITTAQRRVAKFLVGLSQGEVLDVRE